MIIIAIVWLCGGAGMVEWRNRGMAEWGGMVEWGRTAEQWNCGMAEWWNGGMGE